MYASNQGQIGSASAANDEALQMAITAKRAFQTQAAETCGGGNQVARETVANAVIQHLDRLISVAMHLSDRQEAVVNRVFGPRPENVQGKSEAPTVPGQIGKINEHLMLMETVLGRIADHTLMFEKVA